MPRWTDTQSLRLLVAICEEHKIQGVSWATVRRAARLETYSVSAVTQQFAKLRREARLSVDEPSPSSTPRNAKRGRKGVCGGGEEETAETKVKVEAEAKQKPAQETRQKVKLEVANENGVIVLPDSADEGLYDVPPSKKRKRGRGGRKTARPVDRPPSPLSPELFA